LETITLAEMEADILAAQERLQVIAPHQRYWTFAYPCSGTFVGRGKNRQSYVPVVARHFLAGRTVGEYGFGNSPALVDLACLWGMSVERFGALVRRYEGELLGYLRRRDKVVWTAPVFAVAKRIAEFQAMLSSYAETEQLP